MSTPVDRTCTEIDTDGHQGIILGEPKPLSAFRQSQAYVLLGDAGSGKTTEFKKEAEAMGDAAEYLSAREFNRSHVDSRQEWRDKVLFIDGLDEIRAGKTDSLTPLDQIISQLDRLERPRLRISCREADWLGTNDRKNLDTVSPDLKTTVLRLEPLDEGGITALLNTLELSTAPTDFIDEARDRELGAILHNPQTLKLLAEAVEQGGAWPSSRRGTFEMACRKMASEQNDEHLERVDPLPPEVIVDAAGYLCAVQLLAGTEGYSMTPLLDDLFFPSVDELHEPPNQLPRNNLKQALATRLFTGVVERQASPIHRHVAEFLAGRFLAKQIDQGLPVERVLALMTSPNDQRVVSVLRGLSAWLAAHSPIARRSLIEADPVGVGLYGDIEALSKDEKKQLLESLAAFAEQGRLFGHERADSSSGWHRRTTAQAFRSLASADMANGIKEVLTRQGSEPQDHRIIGFVLEVLAEADESELDSLSGLTADIESVLVDPLRPADLKVSALDAYLHLRPPAATQSQLLLRLLEETHRGVHLDPADELRGALLERLYPDHLPPNRVWKYLVSPNERTLLGGRFWTFNQRTLLEKSSDQQIGELLDALHLTTPSPRASRTVSALEALQVQVLARGLEKSGDDVEPARLYNWLSTTSPSQRIHPRSGEPLHYIQSWLQGRPETQKDVYLAWLRHRHLEGKSNLSSHWNCNALNESTPPADFGLWCLQMAVQLEQSEPPIALALLNQAYLSLQQQSGSHRLTLDVMKGQVAGHNTLAGRLDELCTPPPPSDELSTFESEMRDRMAKYDEEKRQRQSRWADLLRSREDELKENRIPPHILNDLAKVYFALFAEVDQDASPPRRISEWVGGDPVLVDAVMAALRNAIWRDDLPEAPETISLSHESRCSFLAFPVMASLELLNAQSPTLVDECDDSIRRRALAIHFCIPKPLGHGAISPSFDRWVLQDPELVLDVLNQCAISAVRARQTSIPGFNDLDQLSGHPDLANTMRLRLLDAFSVRAPRSQHELLDRLLSETLRHPDTTELLELALKKLSSSSMTVAQKVRWMTVAAVVAPNPHLGPLSEFVGYSEKRTEHMAEFFRNCTNESDFGTSYLGPSPDPAVLKAFIKTLGRIYSPLAEDGLVTLEIGTSDRIGGWIRMLGSQDTNLAKQALSDLVDDPELVKWRAQLKRNWEHQVVVLSDASYCHPSIEQVQRTLDNGLPANAADLAALLNDHLSETAAYIRGDNSNPWQDFWNEGPEPTPRHEESCRDTLIRILRACGLSHKIDLEPERRHPSARRADISAKYGGFNVPVEIKKNSHSDLWDSLHKQLIALYTTDPATSGHGIYLVLWFGAEKTARSPEGHRPATPDELRDLLERDLKPDQATKVSVRVLDVTKP